MPGSLSDSPIARLFHKINANKPFKTDFMKTLYKIPILTKFPILGLVVLCFALCLITLSCKKEKELSYEEKLNQALSQTHFEHWEGTMYYLKNDDRWAIKFEPDLPPIPPEQGGYCYAGYIAMINNPENLPEEFRIEGKKVLFSGDISACPMPPDMTGLDYIIGTKFKNLNLSSIVKH